ncbi:extracellular catalytic domain type 1 short-chain-length polyhydroxyalkanoate depolymerase [Trinickia mobilis]|uniref:extracellular catalytic domain type 1 short-chain-length polyhydroxyalkanoate depolymerase n=1 Tax=Trinickia mobilis TaxID=2816356 RepID=UPI001A8EF501|nr:PHB depolymerase family esterase [Trinickia mobilis]
MTKSLTKIWLGGLKRLLAIQAEHAQKRAGLKAKRPVGKAEKKARKSAAEAAVPPARESRVRPRAAAWAGGSWTRSFHSAPPAPGRLVNHLSYGLYLPAGASHAESLPLVVMLHGCKQTIDEFAEGTRMNLLADKFGFAVVYPEQSKHIHAHRCWHWYDDREHAGRGEARAVASLVDALVAEHGFDAESVYVAGLSAGAGLTSLLALHHPDRFAAVALHSGPVFGDAHSGIAAMDVMRRGSHHDPAALVDEATDVAAYPGMPAVIIHGDADRVVAPKNADQLALEFARLNGLVDATGACVAGDVRERRKDGVLTRDYMKGGRRAVRLCRVAGLGHAWAGGDDAVPFHSSKGPDASALIWDFFQKQHRPQTARAAASPATAGLSAFDSGRAR